MTRALGVCVAVLIFVLPGSARAAVQIWSDSIPDQSTNWSGSMTVPQFNPSLGTLTSVDVLLNGGVSGSAKYESFDNAPTTIGLNLQATIKLTKPDSSLLVQVIPLASISDSATAYDTVFDYDGSSGGTFSGLSGTASDSTTLTAPLDLAAFTGIGTISLPAFALGQSNGSGGGNLVTQFITSAGAGMTVRYNYNTLTTVPEPGAFLVFGLLIGCIAIFRKSIGRAAVG